MISAKLATLGLPKIKIFQNKGSGIMNLDYDVANKILSLYLIYSVNVVM